MRLFQFVVSTLSVAAAQGCTPVHIIVSRASGEAPGEGISAQLSVALKKALPGTTSEALECPARMPYNGSMALGMPYNLGTSKTSGVSRLTAIDWQDDRLIIGSSMLVTKGMLHVQTLHPSSSHGVMMGTVDAPAEAVCRCT